jgi:hypothetical protein
MSWLSEAITTIKAMTTPEHAPPLPPFPAISGLDLLPGDALLFYGYPGTQITQRLGFNKYGYPFHPAFHAALTETVGLFHNVGQFTTNKLLVDEYKSSRRIDVVRYQMTDAQRATILQATILDTTVPRVGLNLTSYGVMDFLHFGFAFIGKGKTPVCSADVVNLLLKGGVTSSPRDALDTAPWDLQEYAAANPALCQQYTLWSGPDYHP